MTEKKWLILVLSPFVGTSLYALSMPDPASILHWIDGLTYSSLLLFMCGGIFFVRNGKFFRPFWDSCKRFYASFRKKEMYLREREGKRNSVRYKQTELPHRPVLLVALLSFLVSLLLSVLYVNV